MWSEFDKSCYKLLDNSGAHYSNRDVCNQECVSAGGMLTSIHSQEENNFLASLLPQDGSMWTIVGGEEVGRTNTFAWMDGTEWDYENWAAGILIIITANIIRVMYFKEIQMVVKGVSGLAGRRMIEASLLMHHVFGLALFLTVFVRKNKRSSQFISK